MPEKSIFGVEGISTVAEELTEVNGVLLLTGESGNIVKELCGDDTVLLECVAKGDGPTYSKYEYDLTAFPLFKSRKFASYFMTIN